MRSFFVGTASDEERKKVKGRFTSGVVINIIIVEAFHKVLIEKSSSFVDKSEALINFSEEMDDRFNFNKYGPFDIELDSS